MTLWLRHRDDALVSAELREGMSSWEKVIAIDTKTGHRFPISKAGLLSMYDRFED